MIITPSMGKEKGNQKTGGAIGTKEEVKELNLF
jgi:hypothetical protein